LHCPPSPLRWEFVTENSLEILALVLACQLSVSQENPLSVYSDPIRLRLRLKMISSNSFECSLGLLGRILTQDNHKASTVGGRSNALFIVDVTAEPVMRDLTEKINQREVGRGIQKYLVQLIYQSKLQEDQSLNNHCKCICHRWIVVVFLCG